MAGAALALTLAASWLAIPVFGRVRDRLTAVFDSRRLPAGAGAAWMSQEGEKRYR